jgi:hypothetical protein
MSNCLQPRQLELLAPEIARSCDICGAGFVDVKRRGRPQKFCSDGCRIEARDRQKAAWNRRNARPAASYFGA